jgi:hypothetical protein
VSLINACLGLLVHSVSYKKSAINQSIKQQSARAYPCFYDKIQRSYLLQGGFNILF